MPSAPLHLGYEKKNKKLNHLLKKKKDLLTDREQSLKVSFDTSEIINKKRTSDLDYGQHEPLCQSN